MIDETFRRLSHSTEAPGAIEKKVVQVSGAKKDARVSRVLLAEDNEVNGQIVFDFLHETSMPIDWVRDGRQAVALAMTNDYALILMDISMPVLDGFEACRRIRRLRGQRKQPKIIALTAYALSKDRERRYTSDFDGYVAKPIRKATLMQVLNRTACKSNDDENDVDPSIYSAASTDFIDEQAFDEFVDDRGPEKANQLLLAISDELSRRTEELIQKVSADTDLENLSRNFHNMSSIAATVGARRLALVARRCEEACARGHLPSPRAFQPFLKGISRLVDECRRRAETLNVASA